MKPRLALYLNLLPKRWWEYNEHEKRELANTYQMIICTEPIDVRRDIRSYNRDILLIFPWMPQLVPEATAFHEWNPSRHSQGWDLPYLLRDRRGNPIVSDRSYGCAWLDCSDEAVVIWLLAWMRRAWYTKLGGYDGFTLEVSDWTRPWRGFFPPDMKLDVDWDTFSERWLAACDGFLDRLRRSFGEDQPKPYIISGSDWLAGPAEPMDGRLVEDFGLRCTFLEDVETREHRSIHDSQTRARQHGHMTVVKEGTYFPTPAAYAAAAMWDTFFTVMDWQSGPLPHLGFAQRLPGWDLSLPLGPVEKVRGDFLYFTRRYEAGRLTVSVTPAGQPRNVQWLPAQGDPPPPPPGDDKSGCLGSILTLGGLIS